MHEKGVLLFRVRSKRGFTREMKKIRAWFRENEDALLFSSTMDFPEEYTKRKEVLEIAKALRE